VAIQTLGVSDDTLREHAYGVARGVRPLALVEEFPSEPLLMLRAATRIEAVSDGCVPFVVDHGDGFASCGFAASAWAVDLYRWVRTTDDVPQPHRDQVMGLLLGYSVEAVSRFVEFRSGRHFDYLPRRTDEAPGDGPTTP
jgi:hypothetical protein